MNNQQHMSFGAQPKRSIPVPRIVKPGQPAASSKTAGPPKTLPAHPLKPASVQKAAVQKHVPWLTTSKIPKTTIPKIP
jgi:hypothetical protein